MRLPSIITVAASLMALCTATSDYVTVPVYLRPIEAARGSSEPELIRKGTIEYEVLARKASYSISHDPQSDFSGQACIGTVENNEFQCFQLIKAVPGASETFTVDLNPSNPEQIVNLDYVSEAVVEGQAPKHTVLITSPAQGPLPSVKEPIKLVDNKIPEPVVEKTFIQKYWIYILPAVLMLVVSGGGGEQQ